MIIALVLKGRSKDVFVFTTVSKWRETEQSKAVIGRPKLITRVPNERRSPQDQSQTRGLADPGIGAAVDSTAVEDLSKPPRERNGGDTTTNDSYLVDNGPLPFPRGVVCQRCNGQQQGTIEKTPVDASSSMIFNRYITPPPQKKRTCTPGAEKSSRFTRTSFPEYAGCSLPAARCELAAPFPRNEEDSADPSAVKFVFTPPTGPLVAV